MESRVVPLRRRHLEESIIRISAKIADAAEMMQRGRELTARSENMLIKAQIELEELSVKLEDEFGED